MHLKTPQFLEEKNEKHKYMPLYIFLERENEIQKNDKHFLPFSYKKNNN